MRIRARSCAAGCVPRWEPLRASSSRSSPSRRCSIAAAIGSARSRTAAQAELDLLARLRSAPAELPRAREELNGALNRTLATALGALLADARTVMTPIRARLEDLRKAMPPLFGNADSWALTAAAENL